MTLAIAFPLVAYGLFFLLADPARGRRAAAIDAAVLWGVAVFAITEALSLLHALTAAGLASAWLLVDLAAAAVLRRRNAPWPPLGKLFQGALDGLGGLDFALLAGTALLLAGVGVTAIVAPPNTTDALVYHLPRIVHWLDNRSVSFYATHEIRQLQMPPWAEYAMLQFHGLTGGDRFDNLVQWFSLLGSIAGVSLIAKNLGAGMRGQVLAAVVCATIPQGLLEASGAKNDYVTAFWLVALVYYLPGNAWRAGAALGLACLTKSVALLFAPPLVAAMMAAVILSRAPVSSKALRGLALAALVALGLNLPHFVRNYRLFHSIVGPASETNGFQYTNGRFGAGPLLSNALRNLALDAGTPFGSFNRAVESGVVRVLAAVGENPNDPRTTWDYTEFHVLPFSLHEANAGNPLHAALILLVCGILLWRARAKEYRPALWLAMGLIAAFLLFCAVFRWQPWHTRLHLPLFALWAAVIGAVLARAWSRGATVALGLLLLAAATPDAFANRLRPLLGGHGNIFNTPRQDLYFADLDEPPGSYRDAVRFVEASHCPELGLDLSQGGNEYPLDVLLRQQSSVPIRNVFVTNASRVYDRATGRQPACLICPECAPLLPGWATLAHRYRAVRQFGTIAALSGPVADGPLANACTAEFTGWYDVEHNAGDWWRWTPGPGVVHVHAARAMAAELEASVSSLRYPNQVELRVNGVPKALLAIPSPGPPRLLWTPVELREGDNTLEFLSANPPAQLPQDSRWMAIAVRDLAFRTSGGAGCSVDPPGAQR